MTANDKYGDISSKGVAQVALFYTTVPFVLLYKTITAPFSVHRKKSFSRILRIAFEKHKSTNASVRHLQWASGTSVDVYTEWCHQNRLDTVVEYLDIEEKVKLLWLGEKRYDRVIIYLHGGGFLLPVETRGLDFLRHLQTKLQTKGYGVGVAIVDYSLAPFAQFPSQLRQANAAISHLLSAGVVPERLQLLGDSAGGSLLLQVLSHALHPLPSIPLSPLDPSFRGTMRPLRGAYLMSPWVMVSSHGGGSFAENNKKDILSASTIQEWGLIISSPVPSDQLVYLDPLVAPPEWFQGAPRVVERLLVTAGSYECIRDDIVSFTEQNLSKFEDVTMIVQPGGIHNEPLYGLTRKDDDAEEEITGTVVEWLRHGFE